MAEDVTLRDVASDMRAWADTIEGFDEDSPERELALQQQAATLTQGQDKAEAFARFVLRCEAEAAYLKGEAARMTIIPRPSIPDLLDSLEGCQPFVDADLLRLGDEGPIREAEHAS